MKFLKLKKYNYDINKIVGFKTGDKQPYVLNMENKVIRKYYEKLNGTPLLCSYIPIEEVVPFSIEVDKTIFSKINLEDYIRTKIYEEAGLPEQEKYLYKYEVVNSKDDKKMFIQIYLVSEFLIQEHFKDVYERVGYIDYLSFPAFSFRHLYRAGLLTKANDLFLVILKDKILYTLYKDGHFITSTILKKGLNDLYNELSGLNIDKFDETIFKKLLKQKGLNSLKYKKVEKQVIYDRVLEPFFKDVVKQIRNENEKNFEKYSVDYIDRIYITSLYGEINGVEDYFSDILDIDTFDFDFYEKYNLDKLPIDPLLFLSMLETHYSYKLKEEDKYNFTLKKRQPNFFYRPSGKYLSTILAVSLLGSVPLIFLTLSNKVLDIKIKHAESERLKIFQEKVIQETKNSKAKEELKARKQVIEQVKKEKNKLEKLINEAFHTKIDYVPKSVLLADIIKVINKNKVALSRARIYGNYLYIELHSPSQKKLAETYKELSEMFKGIVGTGIKEKEINGKKEYQEQILFKIK